MSFTIYDIGNYYVDHTLNETAIYFKISKPYTRKILIQLNIPIRNKGETTVFLYGRQNKLNREKGIKICSECKQEKLLIDFHKNSYSPDGLATVCVDCRQKYNKRADRKEQSRNRKLVREYNITLEEYNKILILQNYCCAICKRDKPSKGFTKFCVDHDHKTGKVRGLLCNPCNRLIGFAKDKFEILFSAGYYLINLAIK